MDQIYELFPFEIALTGAVVVLVVAVVFRSAFLPLRLALTLALPLTFVFGLAVLFFEGDPFGPFCFVLICFVFVVFCLFVPNI